MAVIVEFSHVLVVSPTLVDFSTFPYARKIAPSPPAFVAGIHHLFEPIYFSRFNNLLKLESFLFITHVNRRASTLRRGFAPKSPSTGFGAAKIVFSVTSDGDSDLEERNLEGISHFSLLGVSECD